MNHLLCFDASSPLCEIMRLTQGMADEVVSLRTCKACGAVPDLCRFTIAPCATRRYVQEAADAHVWVALSPTLRGRLHAADAAGQPGELADLGARFAVGQPLRCRVLQVS
jgi:hypothetical protein